MPAAAAGLSQPATALPFGEQVQTAFGRHDISAIQAHVGGAATAATAAMGAEAYATGDHVAFRATPDLHTAAHEAAHVVQQQAGVSLKGGVGEAGDPYERHADAVADAVVAGRSAEVLLDQMTTSGAAVGGAVQRAIPKSTTVGQGPIADIVDSTVGGVSKTRADECLALAQAGTAFEAHPWVAARTAANVQNPGKVPNSVKKNFKWKWPHRNNAGYLPGVPGAGGYDEYYIMNAANDGPAEYERLVLSTTTADVFHTATHYGDQGAPAFTHFKKA